MRGYNRRTVLKALAGFGTIGVAGVQSVGASGASQYIVTVHGRGGKRGLRKKGYQVQNTLADGEVLIVEGPASSASAIENIPGVQSATENYEIELERTGSTNEFQGLDESTDDWAFQKWQWDKRRIDAPEAHETATGEGAQIAIIDTGVDVDGYTIQLSPRHSDVRDGKPHPDLLNVDKSAGRLFKRGKIKSGVSQVAYPGKINQAGSDDYPETVDPAAGTTTYEKHVADDVWGHGTHVAGTAAAQNDGTEGVIGTAPDADIVPLRTFYWTETETGQARLVKSPADVLSAIDFAAEQGIDVINLSLASPVFGPKMRAAVLTAWQKVVRRAVRAGTVVVAAAGNQGMNLTRGPEFVVPASTKGAMTVSSTGPKDELAPYSNYGRSVISVGAPGGAHSDVGWQNSLITNTMDIDSPMGVYRTFERADNDSYPLWISLLGTSQAAAQVSGAAALVKELAPEASPGKVQKVIEDGAEGVKGKRSATLGAGRLNALNTVNLTLSDL